MSLLPQLSLTRLRLVSGVREGEVSMEAGEHLSVLDEDSGDGWVRVKKTSGNIGYVPASYIQIN